MTAWLHVTYNFLRYLASSYMISRHKNLTFVFKKLRLRRCERKFPLFVRTIPIGDTKYNLKSDDNAHVCNT